MGRETDGSAPRRSLNGKRTRAGPSSWVEKKLMGGDGLKEGGGFVHKEYIGKPWGG